MRPDRFRWITTVIALCALVVTLPACSDDSTGPDDGPAYVGTWNATSFSALGTNFIAAGMTLRATFTETGYSFTVTNDLVGICGEEDNCEDEGPLTATGSQITIDAGEEDEVTFNYSISGSTMTWSGTIDGTPVTVVWARAN